MKIIIITIIRNTLVHHNRIAYIYIIAHQLINYLSHPSILFLHLLKTPITKSKTLGKKKKNKEQKTIYIFPKVIKF